MDKSEDAMLNVTVDWTNHSNFSSTFFFVDRDNYKRDLYRKPNRTFVVRQHWQTYPISIGDFVKLREEIESEVKFYLQPYLSVQVDLRAKGDEDDLQRLNFHIKDILLTGPDYLGRHMVYRPPLTFKSDGVYFMAPDDLEEQVKDYFSRRTSELGVHDDCVPAPVHLFKFDPPE